VSKRLWNDPVLSKVISAGIIALLAAVGTHFNLWPAILKAVEAGTRLALGFAVATSSVPHWLLISLALLAALSIILVGKTLIRPRPKWFNWSELDWQLLGPFFAEGSRLDPEVKSDLTLYLLGPFCRNPACKREVHLVQIFKTRSEFSHLSFQCPCNQKVITLNFKRPIFGISEERAYLVEACREAQAAIRRGERFRKSQ